MKVLVIGGGGREHTLVWKISLSPCVDKIYAIPGNAGISHTAECVPIGVTDIETLADFAIKQSIDLTVVGPEAPLVAGIVDRFEARGLRILGPRRGAARLEGSKVFSKYIMQKYGIPTGRGEIFSDPDRAFIYAKDQGMPIVVKADGLAAGKGVIVCQTLAEVEEALTAIMRDKIFGAAGSQVIMEEYLTGEEVSILAFVDGTDVRLLLPSQDHKAIFDGDKGPNTGGMGAYCPAPLISSELAERIEGEIIRPSVDALWEEGEEYRGVLYAGLMVTEKGPKVLEFNVRFGDPETQAVLPLMETDLVTVMEACLDGRLSEVELNWIKGAAVCVVIASEGYPGKYEKGEAITGLEKLADQEGLIVFHAATAWKEGKLVTAGGRVLGITAVGDNIEGAVKSVYQGIKEVRFKGMYYRKDIGQKGLARVGVKNG